MVIKLKFSALSQDRWYDYAIRFVLGGLATVAAGVVADQFGPSIGGLMLAFPAIFSASATLTERNERRKKEKRGLKGEARGRQAAALDAAGAGWGSVAMISFAGLVAFLAFHGAALSLAAGCLIWCTVAVAMWFTRRALRRASF
jgi:hypothetical protein